MSNQIRISILWIFPALGLVIHSVLEMAESIYFTKNIDLSGEAASISPFIHGIYIVALILPIVISFLTTYLTAKGFKWFSLIYASLLVLLNGFHLMETIMANIGNVTQVILLTFVLITCVLLVVQINQWRKEETIA